MRKNTEVVNFYSPQIDIKSASSKSGSSDIFARADGARVGPLSEETIREGSQHLKQMDAPETSQFSKLIRFTGFDLSLFTPSFPLFARIKTHN